MNSRILTDNELRVLQKEELSILKEIDRICEKYNITYYIVGGTLLGAVRHKGFIPWDDDIDIGMYRNDYKRFEKACEKELGKDFFLQTVNTDPFYYQRMPKVRKNNTSIITESTLRNPEMHNGVFVDIFMLDYERKPLTSKCDRKFKLNRRLMNIFSKKALRKYNNNLKDAVVRIIPRWFINFIENIFVAGKKEKEYTVNYTSIYGLKKQTFPSNYYSDGVKVQFEDNYFNAPKEYIKILESIYGDYMQLPPIEKRGVHHRIIDFKINGKNVE